MCNKQKKNRANRHERKKLDFKLPHNRVVAGIALLATGSLILSGQLNGWDNVFWASIFSNVFAGLITGLVICLISGRKQRMIAELESQQKFLNELSCKIKGFQDLYGELLKKNFSKYDGSEDLFNFIYDVGCRSNWVNDFILQGTFNAKIALDPVEYCSAMGYDALALTSEYITLHNNLQNLDSDCPTKRELIKQFNAVEKPLRKLGDSVYHRQQDIELQLDRIRHSLF